MDARTTSLAAYRERFARVLAYVDEHLGDDLSVDRLASVAAFSKFHFHRQFAATFGLSVHAYVHLVRTRYAAHELAYRPRERILDVALASGYESHEAFARAFKKLVGQTPSEFRKAPAWAAWLEHDARLGAVRKEHFVKTNWTSSDVTLVDFPETRVGVLEHRGDPNLIGDTIRRFIAWRRANDLGPRVSGTFNLLYGDPATTPPDEFRLDLCAEAPRGIAPNADGVVERTLPAGRCAMLRLIGSDEGFASAFRFLYGTWLPASGEELRDVPLFLKRVRFYPDVPANEAVTEIYLPLR